MSHDGFEVELPAGGRLLLATADEREMWEENSERYRSTYGLNEQNDLLLLGAILTQALTMYRAQQRLNGMEPKLDANGIPDGTYSRVQLQPKDMAAPQGVIIKAAEEIRELEKALGIDKKTRESGGSHDVKSYVGILKRAAHEYGVHVTERLKAYEAFNMEMRTKLRMLANDPEDRTFHGISHENICTWATAELAKLEQVDIDYAAQKGKVFVGQVR